MARAIHANSAGKDSADDKADQDNKVSDAVELRGKPIAELTGLQRAIAAAFAK